MTLRIRGRFILFSALSVLGAIAFLPSVLANSNPQPTGTQLAVFVLIVSAICIPAAWIGLRLGDAVKLPMPLLRRLDSQSETPRANGTIPALLCGIHVAAGGIFVLRYFHQPNLGGSLLSRAASTLFAAGNVEIVVHLFTMSLVVRLARGRIWVGVWVSALFFLAFHISGSLGHSAALLAASITINGVFGLLMGLLYARYGYEYMMLGHAVGHLLTVTLA
jgi:hypothetical protein